MGQSNDAFLDLVRVVREGLHEEIERNKHVDEILASTVPVKKQTEAKKVRCSYCGRRIASDAENCPGCGAPA
jgi:rubrerythrin